MNAVTQATPQIICPLTDTLTSFPLILISQSSTSQFFHACSVPTIDEAPLCCANAHLISRSGLIPCRPPT